MSGNINLRRTNFYAADQKVAIDAAATPDFLGAAAGDGCLRTGNNILVADGGDYITLDTIQDIQTTSSPTFGGLIISGTGAPTILLQSTDASDPTLTWKTTNTANQINVFLDESVANDLLAIEGQTASVDTILRLRAKDGENAIFRLYSGNTNYADIFMSAADNLTIKNTVENKNIIFGIDDEGTPKTITWDAENDKLKHSAGTFNFDDDHILTTGNINGAYFSVVATDNYIWSDVVPPGLSGAANNILIGKDAGHSITTALRNVIVGAEAAYDANVNDLIALGYRAARHLTTGTGNFALGYQAMFGNETGQNNVYIGAGAGQGVEGQSHSNNVGIGSGALTAITTASNIVAIGQNSLTALTSGGNNLAIGYQSGFKLTTGSSNVFIGYQAGYNGVDAQTNTVIGVNALINNVSGYGSVAIGYNAAHNFTGNYIIAIGNDAGYRATGANNILIGYRAWYGLTTGVSNTVVGYAAGHNCGTGASNNCIYGITTGYVLTGNNNVGIGYACLRFGTSMADSVAVGFQSNYYNVTGDKTVAIGYKALFGASAQSHNNNVALGYQAGWAVTTGSNNVLLGHMAGEDLTSGSGNVVIGYMCAEGQLTTGNNQLWIHNSDSATPLIYGEFDNEVLLFNTSQMGFFKTAVASQQAHIVDADGTLADITTKFNTLLADLETYGLLAAA
jgi:hypothetical protein